MLPVVLGTTFEKQNYKVLKGILALPSPATSPASREMWVFSPQCVKYGLMVSWPRDEVGRHRTGAVTLTALSSEALRMVTGLG